MRGLDVGCGPGALTDELVDRLGADAVAAVDPAEGFVAALLARHPDVATSRAAAEALPFADDAFDTALAQLVVHFMADPVAGLREMRRVTRAGGVVAACVWDHGGGQGPLTPFWQAVKTRIPARRTNPSSPGRARGTCGAVRGGGPARRRGHRASPSAVDYASFEDWWEPYTPGSGRRARTWRRSGRRIAVRR